MHIAVDARVIGSTTGNFLVKLLEQLEAIDTDNHYSVLVDRDHEQVWTPTNPRFRRIAVDIPHHSWAEQTELLRVLRALKPDLVHFAMPQQPLRWRGPKVTAIHDLTLLRTRNPHKSRLASLIKRGVGFLAFRRAARTSRRVIACSRFSKEDIVRTLGLDPERVAVVYDAAVEEHGIPEPIDLPFPRFLLHIGRFSPYKNLARLCDAHQRLLETNPGLGLVFVGPTDADARELVERCERRGYRDIVFTGFVSAGQRDWLLDHAAVYVFPSLYEGFGLPGLEAMAHGTPVASSDRTSLPEIYGDAAQYFDPENEEAIVAVLARLLGDEELRTHLVAAGHDRAASFSWRKAAEETLLIYRQAAGDNA